MYESIYGSRTYPSRRYGFSRGCGAEAARSHGGSAIHLRSGSNAACKWTPIREEGLSGFSPVAVDTVLEQLCQFRSRVRSFALAPWEAPPPQGPGSASAKPQTRPDRIPLLEACDALRKDLAPAGVLIKELTRRAAPEKDQDQD
ncbi:unnamed protein product [Arctogadus glacialis]